MEVFHLAGVAAVEPVAEAVEAVGDGGAGDPGQLESHRAGLGFQPVLDALAHRATPPRRRFTAFRPAAQSWANTFLIFPSSASACKQRSRPTALASPSSATTSGS